MWSSGSMILVKEEVGDLHAVPSTVGWIYSAPDLDPDHPPNDVSRHRWRQFVADCKYFLTSSENWANRAAGLG
jgi:hypothetical protein